VVVSAFRSIFDDSCRFVVEQPLDAPCSDKESRAADAYVEFVYEPDWQFFDGLAVEVQCHNKSKDKAAVAADYAAQGVATVYVTPDDFVNPKQSNVSFNLDETALRDRARATAVKHIFGNDLVDLRRYDAAVSVFQNRGFGGLGRYDPTELVLQNQGAISCPHAPMPDSWESGGKVALRERHREQVGAQKYIDEAQRNPKKAVVPATVPSEQFKFDLIHQLGENNAPRKCAKCGDPARTYYYTDGAISQFRCTKHLLTEDVLENGGRADGLEHSEVAADD